MADKNDLDFTNTTRLLTLMVKGFPGSWLPYGHEMIIGNAEPLLKLISQRSRKLDYIETIGQWGKK